MANLSQEQKRDLQEKGLDILVKNRGFQFTSTFFPYTSGEIGPYYVQSGVVQANGEDYVKSIRQMAYLVQNTFGIDRLSQFTITGGESRDWLFSNPVAVHFGLPHAMLYKNGKIVGANLSGKDVVHIADLNNEGSSLRDLWVPTIKKVRGNIDYAFFYVDRREGGVEVMKDLGLQSDAVVSLDSYAWDYLKEKGVVKPEEYTQLKARGTTKQERDAWARWMLLENYDGLYTLAEMLINPKEQKKAQKIIYEGYPDLSEEIIDNLKRAGWTNAAFEARQQGN